MITNEFVLYKWHRVTVGLSERVFAWILYIGRNYGINFKPQKQQRVRSHSMMVTRKQDHIEQATRFLSEI